MKNAASENTSEANDAVKVAVNLLKQQRWAEARVAHQELIDLGINKAAGHYGLGVVALMNKDMASAKESFLRCTEFDARNAHAYFNLGIISEQEKALEAAKSYFLKAVENDPKHLDAVAKLKSLASIPSGDAHAGTPIPSGGIGQNTPTLLKDAGGFFAILKMDAETRSNSAFISKQALVLIDRLAGECRPQVSTSQRGKISLALVMLFCLLALLGIFGIALGFVGVFALPAKISICLVVISIGMLLFTTIIPILANYFGLLAFSFGLLRVPFRVWPPFVTARKTVYKFDQGKLQIDSGTFWRVRRTFELYRLTDLALYQSPRNRRTKDGTLLLVFHSPSLRKPAIVRLKGLEKIDVMERMSDDLRQLSVILRMHPLLKGIIN